MAKLKKEVFAKWKDFFDAYRVYDPKDEFTTLEYIETLEELEEYCLIHNLDCVVIE